MASPIKQNGIVALTNSSHRGQCELFEISPALGGIGTSLPGTTPRTGGVRDKSKRHATDSWRRSFAQTPFAASLPSTPSPHARFF